VEADLTAMRGDCRAPRRRVFPSTLGGDEREPAKYPAERRDVLSIRQSPG